MNNNINNVSNTSYSSYISHVSPGVDRRVIGNCLAKDPTASEWTYKLPYSFDKDAVAQICNELNREGFRAEFKPACYDGLGRLSADNRIEIFRNNAVPNSSATFSRYIAEISPGLETAVKRCLAQKPFENSWTYELSHRYDMKVVNRICNELNREGFRAEFKPACYDGLGRLSSDNRIEIFRNAVKKSNLS